jgi:hypothetical protein
MSVREEVQADGTVKIYADYVDNIGRHQPLKDSFQDAQDFADTHDIRKLKTQTWRGYMLYYKAHLPETIAGIARRNVITAINAFLDALPDIRLADLRSSHVAHFVDILRPEVSNGTKAGTPDPKSSGEEGDDVIRRSDSTIENYLYILQHALAYALLDGRLKSNPISVYLAANKFSWMIKPIDPPHVRYYPGIKAHLTEEYTAVGFHLISRCALTSLEAVVVTRDDFDPVSGELNISRMFCSQTNEVIPCRNPASVRTIKLDASDVAFLADHCPDGSDEYFMRHGNERSPVWGRSWVLQKFGRTLKEAQLAAGVVSMVTNKPYRSEDFRDRCVVDWLNRPRSNFVRVQAAAGYANVNAFTLRYDSHIRAIDSHQQMSKAKDARAAIASIAL